MLANQFIWPTEIDGQTLLASAQNLQALNESAASEEPLLISTYNPDVVASVTTPKCVEPDLDSLEYSVDENLPSFQREDKETVQTVALIGEILIGLGLAGILGKRLMELAFVNTEAVVWSLVITSGGITAFVYGLITFVDYMNFPSAYNAFRTWKINFLVIWISLAVALLQLITMFIRIAHNQDVLPTVIATSVCSAFIGVGLWLVWSMKQLWILEDSDRTLAFEYFDYFGEPEVADETTSDPEETSNADTATDEASASEKETTIDATNADTTKEESATTTPTSETNSSTKESTTASTSASTTASTSTETSTTATTKPDTTA